MFGLLSFSHRFCHLIFLLQFFLFIVFVCFNVANLVILGVEGRNCRQKWFAAEHDGNGSLAEGQGKHASFVCVCTAAFCDEPEPTGPIGTEQIAFFLSDRQHHRLHRTIRQFDKIDEKASASSGQVLISVDSTVRFQTLLGFGGAFTDSVGINLNKLSAGARDRLLQAYFDGGGGGIGYGLGRVPIGSTDFSTREYSYADEEDDFDLETFALAREDLEAKIPYIQTANRLSGGRLRLLAVPWAAPGWMKTTERMSGPGQLKGDLDGPYYWSYARYLKRFFDEYNAHGINFWAMTLQNHPEGGLDPTIPFQAMLLPNHTQRKFAARLLAPILRKSPHTASLQLLAYDNPREHLVSSAREIFASTADEEHGEYNELAIAAAIPSIGQLVCQLFPQVPLLPAFLLDRINNFCATRRPTPPADGPVIAGVGLHWYMREGHEAQNEMHWLFPSKFILPTEACTGFAPEDAGPRLGNWTRGWMYGHDIVQNLRNWAVGWLDWNLCLNMEGGPNWVGNFVDSPIIVNLERDEFYKQPMFYVMAHFSRFIPPGSVRIDSLVEQQQQHKHQSSPPSFATDPLAPSVDHVAFLTPAGDKVLVLVSPPGQQTPIHLRIRDVWQQQQQKQQQHAGTEAAITLEPDSIVTVIWK